MNTIDVVNFVARSLGVGVVAWLLILIFCQASHRVRIAVITAAWAMLAVLMVGCFLPLPRLEVWQVSGPAILDGATSQTEGVLIGVWLAGATVAVGREVFGLLRLRQLIRGAEPIKDEGWIADLAMAKNALGLSLPIELRWSDQLGPCAAGWLSPVILLPGSASEWRPEMRAQVLIHELAHFRGRDLWVLMAIRLIAAAHWFNPFTFILQRSLEAEREQVCDAFVVRIRGDAVGYARALLDLANGARRSRPVPAVGLLSRQRSKIENRIRQLLRNDRAECARRRWLELVLAGFSILLLVACSVAGPVSRLTDRESMASEVELRMSADPFPGNE